jgi:putative hydrolase of the HAD superfamily
MAEHESSPSPIKLITLDLDNTLWPVEEVIRGAELAMRKWLATAVPGFNERYPFAALAPFREALVQEQPELAHDLSRLRLAVIGRALEAYGLKRRRAEAISVEAFKIFIHGRHQVRYYPGVEQLLQRLARRYPLAALSNGNADVAQLSIAPAFAFSCSAADVGASKPRPDMFLTALARARVAPEEAVHVGDAFLDDVQGARAVGMHAVWLDWHGEVPAADLPHAPSDRIGNISELPQALGRLERLLASGRDPKGDR